jgi:lysophospholipase L1-like esterase
MQFGHNDGSLPDEPTRARGSLKGIGDESSEIENPITKRHETVYSYGWYLRKYIAETKAAGATPIVCSPIPRLNWKDGHIQRGEASYAGWAQEVAKAAGVPFVDLNTTIADKLDSLGETKVEPLFFGDHTHTSLAGAELNAACVVKASKSTPLAAFLVPKPEEKNACEVKP